MEVEELDLYTAHLMGNDHLEDDVEAIAAKLNELIRAYNDLVKASGDNAHRP